MGWGVSYMSEVLLDEKVLLMQIASTLNLHRIKTKLSCYGIYGTIFTDWAVNNIIVTHRIKLSGLGQKVGLVNL